MELEGADEPIVLITSLLDEKKYSYEEFQNLYHLRWGIEEDFKRLKSRLQAEQFTGKSVEAIHQDFYAKMLAKNLCALVVNEASIILKKQPAKDSINTK